MDKYIINGIEYVPMSWAMYCRRVGIPVKGNPNEKGYLIRLPDGYEGWFTGELHLKVNTQDVQPFGNRY